MTLAYSLKNGRTIDQNLRSCVFGQNFDKTSGGYLGDLKPFFGATKGMNGCPLHSISYFRGQIQFLGTPFSRYHILSLCPLITFWMKNTKNIRLSFVARLILCIFICGKWNLSRWPSSIISNIRGLIFANLWATQVSSQPTREVSQFSVSKKQEKQTSEKWIDCFRVFILLLCFVTKAVIYFI